MSRRIIFATALVLVGCASSEGTESSTAVLRGRVSGYVATGDVVHLGNVRITARSTPEASLDETIDLASTILSEAISNPDGTYEIDVPTDWASLTFEHEGYARTVRTQDFGFAEERSGVDVHLSRIPETFQFSLGEPGSAPRILSFDSPAGRDYARLTVQPGDLETKDGSVASGVVTAKIAAPHPKDTHKDAFPQSLFVEREEQRYPFEALGMLSVEFTQNGEPLALTEGQTLEWEVTVATESRPQASRHASSGQLRSYSYDADSALWVRDADVVAYADGKATVLRSHLNGGAIGFDGPAFSQDLGAAEEESQFRAAEPEFCPDPGRSAVVLLTLSNPQTPTEVADTIMQTSVAYVANHRENPEVLVVLDDNHNGESVGDAAFIQMGLQAAGYSVDLIDEPHAGLQMHDVEDYDVVWLTNPGYPIDDATSLETLSAFRAAGGGFILSGDDITMGPADGSLSLGGSGFRRFGPGGGGFPGGGAPGGGASTGGGTPAFSMEDYTFLDFVDNGTTTCGFPTNDDTGVPFRVTFEESDHLLAAGLGGVSFLYSDDIDHSVPIGDGEEVLAWATLEGVPTCGVRIPVVVAIDIQDSSQSPECACSDDSECLGAQHCHDNICASCSVSGYSCTSDDECCGSLTCGTDGVCGDPCQASGDTCEAGGDCCGTLSCIDGTCNACAPELSDCSADSDCCGGLLCVEGACQACRAEGEQCGESGDCCGGGSMDCTIGSAWETVRDLSDCEGDRILEATIRDFRRSHADFEYRIGSELGIVESVLGMDGKPVYAGDPTTFTTNGAHLFDQWFADVDGVNVAIPVTLELVDRGDGVLQYKNNAFFPIDDRGFGNEGNFHNYHFTLEAHTEFTYVGGETFTFTGDDDLFAFINGRLAIDLGGVHGSLSRTVDLDAEALRLGIETGETYDLDIFFAERHTVSSNFRIDTTISCLGRARQEEVVAPRCTPVPDDDGCEDPSHQGVVGMTAVRISGGAYVSSGTTTGDVASNGDIDVSGTSVVEGGAHTADGEVDLSGGGTVLGTIETAGEAIYAPIDSDAFHRAALVNMNATIAPVLRNNHVVSLIKNGGLWMQDTDSVTLLPGDYYFSSISLSANAVVRCTGPVNLYVTGKVSVTGDVQLNNDNGCDLTIKSNATDDVTFAGTSLSSAYVYAPAAKVKVSGDAILSGAALGEEAQLSGNSQFVSAGDVLDFLGICTPGDDLPDDLPDLPDVPLPELPS